MKSYLTITEIRVSDGEIRQFKAGDVFIAKDTTGKGHISRSASHVPRKTLVILLGDNPKLSFTSKCSTRRLVS